ncbi:MAG: 4Fe-4S binding protein [Thermoanaerobacteraceae bacterium]|nr:4Fe-4S binding protein [Thermoanaerobacteraceae bacterium]
MLLASITLNRSLCKRCLLCVEFCPQKVFTTDQDNYPVITHLDRCRSCYLCIYRCPDFAVEVTE